MFTIHPSRLTPCAYRAWPPLAADVLDWERRWLVLVSWLAADTTPLPGVGIMPDAAGRHEYPTHPAQRFFRFSIAVMPDTHTASLTTPSLQLPPQIPISLSRGKSPPPTAWTPVVAPFHLHLPQPRHHPFLFLTFVSHLLPASFTPRRFSRLFTLHLTQLGFRPGWVVVRPSASSSSRVFLFSPPIHLIKAFRLSTCSGVML